MTPEEFKQAIKEFKEIFHDVFGVELTDEDATIKVKGMLQLFNCLTER